MTLLIIYTITASILVPLSLIALWFAVRWWYKRRIARRKAGELDRLLGFDERDCYTQNDKV